MKKGGVRITSIIAIADNNNTTNITIILTHQQKRLRPTFFALPGKIELDLKFLRGGRELMQSVVSLAAEIIQLHERPPRAEKLRG